MAERFYSNRHRTENSTTRDSSFSSSYSPVEDLDNTTPPYTWKPGAVIPQFTTPPPGRTQGIYSDYTPRAPQRHQHPIHRRHVETEDPELVPASDTVDSSILQAILSSQQEMKESLGQAITQLSQRVGTLESNSPNESLPSPNVPKKAPGRLPSELSSQISTIYQSLAPEKKFHLTESSNSTWNKKIKKQIMNEIKQDKENKYSSVEIETAIRRYYESRKRIYRESQPEQKERVKKQERRRKVRARRQRLFDRRKKQVKTNEKKHWDQLSIEYMSLESSDDEDGDRIIVHHLPWRSKKLKHFMKILDQRADVQRQSTKHYSADRKQRCDGLDADTVPPSNAPKWSVDKQWKLNESDGLRSEDHELQLTLSMSDQECDD